MAKHLKFGGSTFDRTLNCPAWTILSEGIPPQPASIHADTGSLLHECMENLMRDGLGNCTLPEKFGAAVMTDELFTEKVMPAYRITAELLGTYDIEHKFVEPFVELIPDEAGGSIDLLGVSEDGKTMLVLDYKFGFNPVGAEENSQMLFYALCACVDPRFAAMLKRVNKVVLAIVQPADDGTCDPKVWETTTDRLDEFEMEAYRAIDAVPTATAADANPGPWCRYCPARAICRQQMVAATHAMKLQPQHIATLTEALTMADALEGWAKEVRKVAHEQMERGVRIEGFKLVNKRPTRVWTDPAAVEKKVKNARGVSIQEAHETTLLSPAKMEKLFKKKELDVGILRDYIASVSSGTTLAPADDKRPEALPTEALAAAAKTLLNK